MNKVILFQEYHFGDVFFSVEIIKNIVKCNPHLEIYIMNTENYYYICSNINNIASFLKPTNYNKNNVAWEIINNIILINMWCEGGIIKSNCICSFEQQNRLIQIINQINSKYTNINFKYNSLTKSELIPQLKLSTIPDSIQNKLNNNDKRIFYYNVSPRSEQYQNKKINHNNNIIKLCNEFKEYSIIIPKSTQLAQCIKLSGKKLPDNPPDRDIIIRNERFWQSDTVLTYPNLICLDNDGIIEKPDAENVVQYAQIARNCQHVILYDCGVCFPSLVNNNNHLYIVRLNSNVSFSDIIHQRKSDNEFTKEMILDKDLINIII